VSIFSLLIQVSFILTPESFSMEQKKKKNQIFFGILLCYPTCVTLLFSFGSVIDLSFVHCPENKASLNLPRSAQSSLAYSSLETSPPASFESSPLASGIKRRLLR
jgi:hypothetical protein